VRILRSLVCTISAQIARRVMPEIDYFAELAFEKYDHASSDLGCWNCHRILKVFLLVWSGADRLEPRHCCKRRSLAGGPVVVQPPIRRWSEQNKASKTRLNAP